jgi:signal peptide peptidase SppA
MKVIDILSSPWAIRPQKYVEICDIYLRHCHGEKADLDALEARLGRPLDNKPPSYVVRNGVALLPLQGIVSQRMGLFHDISGGVSTDQVGQMFSAAMNDPQAHSIALLTDSPGGSVSGVQLLARQIFAARGVKPVIALSDGMMASAAYWIGAAADKVYITDNTVLTGSIGVVATHEDFSKYMEMRGIKVTEITAGKYKRIASQYEPLSAEGRQSIQGMIDYVYSVFVNDVAAFRGTSPEDVLARMADGREFTGRQAIDAGLVDSELTLEAVIQQLNDDFQARSQGGRPSISTTRSGTMSEETKTLSETEAQDRASKAAATERERVLGIQALSLPGHEDLVRACIADGLTVEGASLKILTAEKAKKAQVHADIVKDAPRPAPTTTAPDDGAVAKAKADEERAKVADAELPIEDRAKKEWAADAKVRGEFLNVEGYVAFRKAQASGQVRILDRKAS